MLLEAWRAAESSFGAAGDVAAVENKLPRKIKMRRMVTAPDGSELGLEVGVPAPVPVPGPGGQPFSSVPRIYGRDCALTPFPPSFTRWQEYYDYTFPDDEKKVAGLKVRFAVVRVDTSRTPILISFPCLPSPCCCCCTRRSWRTR